MRITQIRITPAAFADPPLLNAVGSVDIILSDHHFWGGLKRSGMLAGIAETFTMSLSMHSNSHLGISLGVELDREKLARLHRAYLDCGIRNRDDTGYMQRFDPEYTAEAPRW